MPKKVIFREINGNKYAYEELESKWNPNSKQCRKKYKYLGKYESETGKILRKQASKKSNALIKILNTLESYTYGQKYFGQEIIKQLNLNNILKRSFSEEQSQTILNLALYKIFESKGFYLYEYWAQEVNFSKLSARDISDFFQEIADEDLIEDFFTHWSKEVRAEENLMFDITSISSYSNRIDFLQRGYNRDGENLKQFNLGILMGRLPLAYRVYPGSINDVSTLKNILKLFQSLGIKDPCYIMDKGFYSRKNLEDAHNGGFYYIIPMSYNDGILKEFINTNYEKLIDTQSLILYEHEKHYYFFKKEIQIKATNCYAYTFLDPQQKVEATNDLLIKLQEFEDKFNSKKFKTLEDAQEYLNESALGKNYYDIVKDKIILQRKKDEIEDILKFKGIFVLLSNKEWEAQDILNKYRSKDIVEKVFNDLKNSIKEDRPRVKGQVAMESKVFVLFIALILMTHIKNVARDKKLFDRFTINKIIYELRTLKLFKLSNGTKILREVTKKQKEIFKAFGIPIPMTQSAS